MIEVEIRAKLNNFEEIKKKLENLGAKFLKKEKQIDKIFGHSMFLDSKNMIIEGGIVPRIRQKAEDIILEFKEICREGAGFEIKSSLTNISLGIKFLTKMGFKEAFTVSKERTEYSLEELTICLDSVEGLGDFIEIEKMIAIEEEKENAKKQCFDLLNKIAQDSLIESRKYGDLIQEKINKGEKI
ncbi:MAG: class IV adenylate cyclase [Nanoarchaeota archaeon]